MGWSLEYVDVLDVYEAQKMISILQDGDVAIAQEKNKAGKRKRR